MSQMTIAVPDHLLHDAVSRLVAYAGYDAVCAVQQADVSAVTLCVGEERRVFAAPLRLGTVMDAVEALAIAQQSDSVIAVGPYHLRAIDNVLCRDGVPDIRLTDTEKRLLLVLAQSEGRMAKRDDLLARVWGMRPDLDTHPVETHIYRLRQKIEDDPSAPQILMTRDEGYLLT